MEPTFKVPLLRRINFRILIFACVVVVVVGYPVYVFVDAQLTSGIRHLAGGVSEIDLKTMSLINVDPEDAELADIPQHWRDLDGTKVVAYGELANSALTRDGLAPFVLCYSRKACGRPPILMQRFVHLRPAGVRAIEYDERRMKVSGTLHVNVMKDPGRIASFFQLDVDSIEPAE